MRPRFGIDLRCDAGRLMEVMESRLENDAEQITGTFSKRHAVLRLPDSQRHFWTPQLSVQVEELRDAPGYIHVQGIFSPNPSIWTAFVFTYGVLFMIGLCGAMYGVAQLSLGQAPWGFAAVPTMVAVAAFVYGAAYIGQGLALTEMYLLRRYLDECLDAALDPRSARPRTAGESAQL